MSYFIFDMDETLAELYTMYYFVASLRLKETIEEDDRESANNLPESLKSSLNKAYTLFVNEITKEEASSRPLGILRPGILHVMRRLNELQKAGKIKNVIIYSNNGHLQSLEFIRDIIHKYLGTTQLIKECIHWNHPMRDEERFMRPGAANKTWNVLKNIMVEGNCKASPEIQPSNVYFFDDLDHKDLQEKLGANYFKVPGYNFKTSFDRVAEIYKKSVTEANIDIDTFMNYIIELFVDTAEDYSRIRHETIEEIIDIFRGKTRGTSEGNPPVPDSGIEMMMEAIKRVSTIGGKRKRLWRAHTRKRRVRRQMKTVRKN
jgi:hypothetical protein